MTFVAVGLSFYAVRRKEYTEECRIYEWLHRDDEAQGWIVSHADWTLNGADWQITGPDWLLPVIGEDRYNEVFARLCAVDAGGDDLKEAAKLRRLILLRLGESSDKDTVHLTQISTLEAIEVMYWSIHDEKLHVALPQLPNLRALNAEPVTGSMSELPNWRISGLSGLKSLEGLRLADDEFDDAAMVDLDGMTRLQCLDLSGTKITAAGLRHLEKARELYWLVLSQTPIDDAAMPIIAQMKTLGCLDLSQTHITDAGLECLKSLKELNTLHLSDTPVTAEGVHSLQQALPNCKIYWSPASP